MIYRCIRQNHPCFILQSVVIPEMPYSKTRFYDKSYEGIMAEIDVAVATLKKHGAKKIFIAGHRG
ncbi:MAG: hypothetical protein C0392_04120 [Syntrophus sp. (in: bacteria)]|nr:hypothetical protein [Syntrophus sp. (in: bacteria)]